MNAALIFVYSDRVGPYINALSYLHDKRGVSSYKFVFVINAMMEGPQTDFIDSIISTFEDLASSTYLGRTVHIDPQTQTRYGSIAATLRASTTLTETVSLEELGDFLAVQSDHISPHQLLIDVTGLPKSLMAHVMLICLVDGYHVHAFELRHKLNRPRPELSLYFSLPSGGFDYPLLTRDPAVQASLGRLVHIRRVMWITAALSAIGIICSVALLVVDSKNTALIVIGLSANIVGIASGALQALAARD